MPALSALVFIAAFGAIVIWVGDWQRDQVGLAEQRYLTNRIEALVDAAFIYRGEHHAWPDDSAELCVAFVNPTQCVQFFDATQDANPMTLSVNSTGSLMLAVSGIENADLAKGLTRNLGAQATTSPDPVSSPNASEYTVTLEIALPFRLSLLEETLLTDGSNAMNKPLMFATSHQIGGSCLGQGISVDSDGALLSCKQSRWSR
ncbi:MAG: hypothetical protein F4W90_03705 [Gammaproteobacteria bacterium]|nr:hypothetical protein [Gammaproteobacteria bacterium]